MRRLVPILLLAAAMGAQAQTGAATSVPPPAPRERTASRVLTLAEAVKSALQRQPALLQSRAGTDAARARSDEAGSALLPQISASASYQRTTSNFTPRPGSTAIGASVPARSTWNTINYFQGSATLSQLIWDFGQTSGRWRAARASAESQRDTEEATRNQVLMGVETAYFTARAGKDLLAVARDALANVEAHLRQTEGFVRVGTHPEIDLAQARTDRANAELQVINAENAYLTEKALLNQAMGVEGPTDYDVASETLPPVDGEDMALDGLLPQALKARPDIAALDAQVRAQQLALDSVRGAYWPALGISTALSDAGLALDSTTWNWNAQVTLSWNLFQGGLTSAQSREAIANIAAAQAQLEAARQQVRVDVEQARLGVRSAKQSLAAAAEALANARERLRLAEGRFRTGVGSAIELGDAQVALTTAAAQRVQAEYGLSSSRAQLLRALGRAPQV